MFTEICLALALAIVTTFFWVNRRPKRYPPGPWKIPVLGNLLNLKDIGKEGLSGLFTKLSYRYGKVFAFDFGSHRAVVVNDYKLIKEAWNNLTFCGRPRIFGIEGRSGGKRRGILFHDGDHWLEQRRFALRHLKEFGFGKRSIENLVQDEISELIEGFKKDEGKAISTQLRFNAAVLNALWTITTGSRFKHDDPALEEILKTLQENLGSTGGNKPVLFLSWLVKLAPKLTGWDAISKTIPKTYNFLWDLSRKILKEYQGNNPEFFAHVFIDEMRKSTDLNSSFYGEEGEKTLVTVLRDLFEAGAETTSTTLTWLFLYMAVFPEYQEILHDEIDRVLDTKVPTLQDRYRMPFTEAIILETLRFSSMVPLGLFHRATQDIHLQEYFIPKDTLVIANLAGVHFDASLWENPKEFNPYRFLGADKTTLLKNPEGFLPFSTGKRVCLGETLARDELFLFVSSIFQQFTVTWDRVSGKPSLEKSLGLIIPPKPHYIVLNQRSKPSRDNRIK